MASLYDLELHESNNFIHSLMAGGVPLSLNLMDDQIKQFKAMGAAGAELLKQMEDPNSEMGKSVARLKAIEVDLKAEMKGVGMTADLAKKAQEILTKNPQSLDSLDDQAKANVQDYWLKKKTIVAKLFAKGYTAQELFS